MAAPLCHVFLQPGACWTWHSQGCGTAHMAAGDGNTVTPTVTLPPQEVPTVQKLRSLGRVHVVSLRGRQLSCLARLRSVSSGNTPTHSVPDTAVKDVHRAGLGLRGPLINPPALMDLRAALLHLERNLAPSNCSRDLLKETEEETPDSSVHSPPGRDPHGPCLPVQGFCICFSLRSGCYSPGDSYSPFGLQPRCPFLRIAFPDYSLPKQDQVSLQLPVPIQGLRCDICDPWAPQTARDRCHLCSPLNTQPGKMGRVSVFC